MDQVRDPEEAAGPGRLLHLSVGWRIALRVAAVSVALLAANQAFNTNFFIGYALIENRYFYLILALMLPVTFLLIPAGRWAPQNNITWYDGVCAVAVFAVNIFFLINGVRILDLGWEMSAPFHVVVASAILWLLVVEATRRAGGTALAVIVIVVSLYPLYAELVPGPIAGFASSFDTTAGYHAMSGESVLGIPLRAFANLVIGFIIFGAALQHTGAGKFFINFAFALLGHVRGGPAKVAIFASGLLGSMSGSVITNVLTTGVMTIPAMRRTGLSRAYAGGVETCASTGGVLMPPVMGAVAFIMAHFLSVPYVDVAIAAAIPSLLYFFGLFVQIDSHSARTGISGLPRDELPSVGQTLREGWHYLIAFALLIFMLLILKREVLAPYYATPALIFLNQIKKSNRWGWAELLRFIDSLGKLFSELVSILAGVGLIIGALSVTGLAGTLVNDLLRLAGGSPYILLLMGALTSFILGIGMTVTAAYIFLAILLAPALIQGGLDPMAVHLFILYWGMLSFITPPVALGAFAAATIAKSNPMETGFEAMRLGSIIYFIPFFFVFDPAFILNGTWERSLWVISSALVGIVFLAGGLQGHLSGFGPLGTGTGLEWPARLLCIVGGLLLAFPGGGLVPWSDMEMTVTAVAVLAFPVGLALSGRKRRAGQSAGAPQ
jgi:TRAP transporter 4TM/12TM fusion protein